MFALGALAAFSQPFTFGVKGGVPLTDFLNERPSPGTFEFSTTNGYIVGPTAEFRLPANLAIEFDALFRHFRYQTGQGPIIGGFVKIMATSNAWELPLLLKYKLAGKFLRPYLDGGAAWDHLQGLSATATSYPVFGAPVTTPISNPPELHNMTSTGIVIGGGIDIHALFFHISPEVRYTRWTSQHFVSYVLNSNQNQAEFLLGISF